MSRPDSHHRMTAENIRIAGMLVQRVPIIEIAEKFELSTKTVARRRDWPEMKHYMQLIRSGKAEAYKEAEEKGRQEAVKESAKAETAKHLADSDFVPVTETRLLDLLLQIAETPPERTRGDYNGQVKAVELLKEWLGFGGKKSDGDSPQTAVPDVLYRAAWMGTKQ